MKRPTPVSPSSLIALAALAVASPGWAEEARTQEPRTWGGSGDWVVEGGVASDNRSKAASKSDGRPYFWGEAAWVSDDRLIYAGSGVETIDASTGATLEVQGFAGVRRTIVTIDLDLQAAFKRQIDAEPDADDEAWELTANLSRSFGPVDARLQVQHSPDGTGTTQAWSWVEFQAGWAPTKALELSGSIGRREQDGSIDYTGWDAGLTWSASRDVDIDLRWYDTDAEVPGRQYAGALVTAIDVVF